MDFSQVAALSDCQLVLAFARRIVDSNKNSFYFECCLLPGVCEVAVCSVEKESPAFERIRKHLKRHVSVINKSRNDIFHGIFTPLPAYHLETDEQQYSIEPEASSSTLNILHLPQAAVEKLSDSLYSVVIKHTADNDSINFLFDLFKKSVTSQSVQFPVGFESSNFARMTSDDVISKFGPISRSEDSSNDLSCAETLNNPDLEWSLLTESVTEAILGWWRKDHDYDCLPWKIGLRYLHVECLLAVRAYNKFQALAQNVTVNVESVSTLEASLDKQQNGLYENLDYVKNIASLEKELVAVLLASEVECFPDEQVGRMVPVTGRIRGEEKPTTQNKPPSPIPPVERRPLITDDTSSTQTYDQGDVVADEQAKRAIALEALAALKCSKQSVKKKRQQEDSSPLRCKICGKVFAAAPTLQAHYQSHAGIKKFECSVCGEKFTRKQSANYHMLCHSGKVRYTCPWCSKLFRHTGHFKDHLRTHQKLPFLCPECHHEFPTRSTLRRHAKLSHGKESLPIDPPLAIHFPSTADSLEAEANDVDVDDFVGTVTVPSASSYANQAESSGAEARR
uniref:C2H2-type domain-containing protein n=1 Tax=Plectus sambesii TaxID=2011161 RepID=A0A914X2W7_9BILA